MEVLLGSLLTLMVIIVGNRMLQRPFEETKTLKLRHTQSYVYSLMAPVLEYSNLDEQEKPERQSTKHIAASYVRVVILDDNAYWIKDNALYVAEMIDGFVNKETTRRVDTMSMDKVELDKTMFVVEKLREGQDNEDRGTGK